MTTVDEAFNLAHAAKVAEKQNLSADAAEKYRACVHAFRAALSTMVPGRSYDLILQQCNGFTAAAERMETLALEKADVFSLPLPPGVDASSESKGDLDALNERLARLKVGGDAPNPSFEDRLQALRNKDGSSEAGMRERLAKLNPDSYAVKAFDPQHNALDSITPSGDGSSSGDPSLDLIQMMSDEVQTLRGMGGGDLPDGVVIGMCAGDSDEDGDAAVANLIAQAQDTALLEIKYGGTNTANNVENEKKEEEGDNDSVSDSDSSEDDGGGEGKRQGKKAGKTRTSGAGLGAGSVSLMSEANSLLAEARSTAMVHASAGEEGGENGGKAIGIKNEHKHGTGDGSVRNLVEEVEVDAAAVAAVIAEAKSEAEQAAAAAGGPGATAAAATVATAPVPVPVPAAAAPPEYLCPITGELLSDPVVCADGHTYERTAIAAWITRHPPPDTRSPMTNDPMHSIEMFPNIALRKLVHEYTCSISDQQ
jgi:hypothetical protein